MRIILVVLGIVLAGFPAAACSIFTGVERFKPDSSLAEPRFDGDFVAQLPAPAVTLDRIGRGIGSDGGMCEDAGTLSMSVSLPRSKFELNEVGFYFRVVSGELPDAIFPTAPVVAPIKRGKMDFLFVWLDGAPSQQRSLDLEVEVFAVFHDLSIGPATRVKVRAAPGQRGKTS